MDILSKLVGDATKDAAPTIVEFTDETLTGLWLLRTKIQMPTLICTSRFIKRDPEGEDLVFEKGKLYQVEEIFTQSAVVLSEDRSRGANIGAFGLRCNFGIQTTGSQWRAIQELLAELHEEKRLLSLEKIADFLRSETFETGDLVTWKDGLANSLRPLKDQICIVIEVLNVSVPRKIDLKMEDVGTSNAGSNFDLVCAIIDYNDDDLMHFLFDSRRMKKVGKLNIKDPKNSIKLLKTEPSAE